MQGLLSIPKLKNANSLGFTVIDAELVKEKEEAGETIAAAGSFEPSQFMPTRTIEKMERRRNVSKPILKQFRGLRKQNVTMDTCFLESS